MAANLKVCGVDPELVETLKRFRFRKGKNCAAIVAKINTEEQMVILDEEHEDISVEDLREELPDHLPRYIMFSYVHNHDDGRVSYPMLFIFISPQGCKPELQMMYAGSKNALVNQAGATKVFELRGKDELTEEWLIQKLSFFR